jgi:hypothetical protein
MLMPGFPVPVSGGSRPMFLFGCLPLRHDHRLVRLLRSVGHALTRVTAPVRRRMGASALSCCFLPGRQTDVHPRRMTVTDWVRVLRTDSALISGACMQAMLHGLLEQAEAESSCLPFSPPSDFEFTALMDSASEPHVSSMAQELFLHEVDDPKSGEINLLPGGGALMLLTPTLPDEPVRILFRPLTSECWRYFDTRHLSIPDPDPGAVQRFANLGRVMELLTGYGWSSGQKRMFHLVRHLAWASLAHLSLAVAEYQSASDGAAAMEAELSGLIPSLRTNPLAIRAWCTLARQRLDAQSGMGLEEQEWQAVEALLLDPRYHLV